MWLLARSIEMMVTLHLKCYKLLGLGDMDHNSDRDIFCLNGDIRYNDIKKKPGKVCSFIEKNYSVN